MLANLCDLRQTTGRKSYLFEQPILICYSIINMVNYIQEGVDDLKGLIIKKPWIDMILDGTKIWEIRGTSCNIRGRIALIESGTGEIKGTVILANSFPLTEEAFKSECIKHRIPQESGITYKKPYVWEMHTPTRYAKPVPYKHPQGAVIWVNLSEHE